MSRTCVKQVPLWLSPYSLHFIQSYFLFSHIVPIVSLFTMFERGLYKQTVVSNYKWLSKQVYMLENVFVPRAEICVTAWLPISFVECCLCCKGKFQIPIVACRQYLCTGYDCYVTQEPCTVCAMALVHSRVSRVIYCKSDTNHGALGGKYKLHSQKSLNHHYTVFRIPWEPG